MTPSLILICQYMFRRVYIGQQEKDEKSSWLFLPLNCWARLTSVPIPIPTTAFDILLPNNHGIPCPWFLLRSSHSGGETSLVRSKARTARLQGYQASGYKVVPVTRRVASCSRHRDEKQFCKSTTADGIGVRVNRPSTHQRTRGLVIATSPAAGKERYDCDIGQDTFLIEQSIVGNSISVGQREGGSDKTPLTSLQSGRRTFA